MKKRLNAAVIGLGIGAKHALFLKSNKKVNLVTLCDVNKKRLNLYKKKFNRCKFTTDANEIFKDKSIDVVLIASYDNLHAKHILQSVKYQKHFFVEKPFCLNLPELKKICLALSHNKKILFSSNLILRNNPGFVELKKNIRKKQVGKIYYSEGDYNYGRIHKIIKGWRGSIPFYSVTLGGSIHLIDLIIWLSEKKVVSVIAEGNNISTKKTKFKFFDLVSSLLKFEDGMIAKVTSNFASVTPHHHNLNIYGTKSTFLYSNGEAKFYRSRNSTKLKIKKFSYPNKKKSKVLSSFIDSIYYKKKINIVPEKEIIDLMSVCLSIEKSLKTKKWEKVKYIKYD